MIKVGDYIRAFLKKTDNSKDFNRIERAGREASPFNRRVEEVIKFKFGKIKTPFSKYDPNYWDIIVVPAPIGVEVIELPELPAGLKAAAEKQKEFVAEVAGIRSFAKTSDGRENNHG